MKSVFFTTLLFVGLLFNNQKLIGAGDEKPLGCIKSIQAPKSQLGLWKPVRHVRLVLHIIQKNDGTGNFAPNNEKDKKDLKNLIEQVNLSYKDIDTPWNYSSIEAKKKHIKNAHIQFFVDTIYYHQNAELYNYKKQVGYYNREKKDTVQDHSKAFDLAEMSYLKYVENNKEFPKKYKDSALNVFMFEAKGMAGRGIAEGLNSRRWLLVVGAYELAQQQNYQSLGLVMAHELGHNMGLRHPFDDNYCADLIEKSIGQTNNLMDAWPNQAKALSSCQVDLVYGGLSDPNSELFSCVDYNFNKNKKSITIHSKEEVKINEITIPEGDIIIEKGGILQVECALLMSFDSKIIILPGGHLIINGGHISSINNGLPWKGIIQEKNRKLLGLFKRKTRSLFNVYNDGYFSGSSDGIMKVDRFPSYIKE